MTTIENPGSLADYLQQNPDNSYEQYMDRVGMFKSAIADALGVQPHELHDMGPETIRQQIESQSNESASTPS